MFSLLIYPLRLGRSAVGRVLKFAPTQNDPFFRTVRARGEPQVRVDATRRRHAARNAISTALKRCVSFVRVVKCADAAPCDARRLEIAFVSSSRERLFRFWLPHSIFGPLESVRIRPNPTLYRIRPNPEPFWATASTLSPKSPQIVPNRPNRPKSS